MRPFMDRSLSSSWASNDTGAVQATGPGRLNRATPSPPRSKYNKTAPRLRPAGERVGVRGREVLGASVPLTPSLSPATHKWAEVSQHLDRGGEGVAHGSSP